MKDTIRLHEQSKVYLPRKCKGVGSLAIIHKYLVCIDEYCMHNNNNMYIYNTANNLELMGEPIKLNSKLIDGIFTYNNELN